MEDIEDLNPNYVTLDNTKLKASSVANPCGLIAKYFFNDTYHLYNGSSTSSERITIDETNIAHAVDREYKFKKPTDVDADSIQWRNVEDGNY